MTIAFDIDRTLDLDPLAWVDAVNALASHGHHCIAITCRPPTDRQVIQDFFMRWSLDFSAGRTYYTSGQSKLSYCLERGIKVDVWVDDDPGCILTGK